MSSERSAPLNRHDDMSKAKKDMTYRDLLRELSQLSQEQLDSSVTVEVAIDEEFFRAELRITDQSDVLDENHPVIYVGG